MTTKRICFTLNNYTEEDCNFFTSWDRPSFLIVGKEIGESGTKHLQGYAEFETSIRFTTLKNIIPRAHFEASKGSATQNIKYCSKENNILINKGIAKNQGKRTDLIKLIDSVKNGNCLIDDIYMEDPHTAHFYGRTLDRVEDICNRNKYKTEMTKGIWYYGPTGTGKSEKAFKDFKPETHYIYRYDNGWYDGYKGQDTMIIDDFRGQIQFSELLRLCDKYPCFLRRRGREPYPFTSKTIIITSSLHPKEIYSNILHHNDSIKQLERRFEIIECCGSGQRVILTSDTVEEV